MLKLLTGLIAFVALSLPVEGRSPLPYRPPLRPFKAQGAPLLGAEEDRGLLQQCKQHYRKVDLDHFSWAVPPKGKENFKQRYFLCDKHWRPDWATKQKGPIFFYVGNEADVELYLNNSGLMWESASEFGALLVFAEHRYYGKSKPYRKNLTDHMEFLTSEQAMADYAELIFELKDTLKAENSPVIGFGGSYGGMLGTWFRYKYPHVIDGIIAGSAPIWNFEGEVPAYDPLYFSKIVTRDASPEAGSSEQCIPNIRRAWKVLFEWGRKKDRLDDIRSSIQLCPQASLESKDDVNELAEWLQGSFDFLAMGNYPYRSSYILNGIGTLPPFPMRVACEFMAEENPSDEAILRGLSKAAGVFYNYTGDVPCFNYSQGANEETDEDGHFWNYQWCTEMYMGASRDGVHDMFWDQPFDQEEAVKGCQAMFGVTPRPLWATVQWGGRDLKALSNVVFSNGNYDPWSGGGVLESQSDSLIAVHVDQGAHHLDLMFSNEDDPPSVKEARAIEKTYIRQWIQQARQQTAKPRTVVQAQ